MNFFEESMPDVMIDCESMGLNPDAPVLSVGAVAFDRHKMIKGALFYANVDLRTSVALGSVIDADTVMWWMKQSDDARSVLTRSLMPAASALQKLSEFLTAECVETAGLKVWTCGDRDCIWLSEHYRKANIELPWKYWKQRDYRTVRGLHPSIEPDSPGVKHNALDDAMAQVDHLFKIRRTLRGNT